MNQYSVLNFVAKILGFDEQKPNQEIHKKDERGKGVVIVKHFLNTPKMRHRQPYDPLLEKQWQNIMKYTFIEVEGQAMQLLKRGSIIQNKLWMWIVGNPLRIGQKLLNIRRTQLQSFSNPEILEERTDVNTSILRIQNNKRSLQKLKNVELEQVLGCLFLQRLDFSMSPILINMAATFYYYTHSDNYLTFFLLLSVSSTQPYLSFIVRDPIVISKSISIIVSNIATKCPIESLRKYSINLPAFIELWLESFFYTVCQNGWQLKQIVITFLLIKKMSLQAISKVCEATIAALSRLLERRDLNTIVAALTSPKEYLDQTIFRNYLFQEKQ